MKWSNTKFIEQFCNIVLNKAKRFIFQIHHKWWATPLGSLPKIRRKFKKNICFYGTSSITWSYVLNYQLVFQPGLSQINLPFQKLVVFLTEHDYLILIWCPILLVCFSCLLCPPLRCSWISSAFFHQWFSSFLVASIVLNQSVSQWFPHSPIFLSSLLVCLCVNQWSSFRDPIKAAELSTFDSLVKKLKWRSEELVKFVLSSCWVRAEFRLCSNTRITDYVGIRNNVTWMNVFFMP